MLNISQAKALLKDTYKTSSLMFFEVVVLLLFLISLPSFEAPKNILLGLYALLVSARLFTQNKQLLTWGVWDSVFLILLISIGLSGYGVPLAHLQGYEGVMDPLACTILAWLTYKAKYSLPVIKLIMMTILLSTLGPLFHGYWKIYIQQSKSLLELNSVGHVNHSAIYLTLAFTISLAWLLDAIQNNKHYILPLLLSFIYGLSIIVSQSRAALGIGLLILLSLIFFLTNSKKRWLSLALIALSISAIWLTKPIVIQKQLANQAQNNVLSYRDKVWAMSWDATKINPCCGVGLSHWGKVTLNDIKNQLEKDGENFNESNYFLPGHAHNIYLNTLTERGFIGLSALILFMFMTMKALVVFYLKNKPVNWLWASALGTWITTFGIGVANTTLHHEHGMLSLVILSLFLPHSQSKFHESIR